MRVESGKVAIGSKIRRARALIPPALATCLLWLMAAHGARATGDEQITLPQVDPVPCLAAIGAGDDDKVVALCDDVIEHEKTARPDRIKALIGRASAYAGKDQIDRAISDYDAVLRLDPTLADIFNARGELWRRKGDRPKALLDFDAAIKLNRDHAAAKANYKSLARELERLGAQMAVAGKPSFNCRTARRAVEKAICADPELADLDREIHAANARVLHEAAHEGAHAVRAMQREQDAFIGRRNAEFGRPGYDLKKAMQERLLRLNGVDGY
jgi:tetratricopeptide (TPR) repeat protein